MGVVFETRFHRPHEELTSEWLQGLLDVLGSHGWKYNTYTLGKYEDGEPGFFEFEETIDGDPTGERLAAAVETTVSHGSGSISLSKKADDDPWGAAVSVRTRDDEPSWQYVRFAIYSANAFASNPENQRVHVREAEEMYSYLRPVVGFTGLQRAMPMPSAAELERRRPERITNVSYLSPDVVEAFGRGRVRSTPAHEIRELEDGGVTLVVDPPGEGVAENRDAVEDHLDVTVHT